MIVLTGSLRRHSRRDFRRNVFHAVKDNLCRFAGVVQRVDLVPLARPAFQSTLQEENPSASTFAFSRVACSSDSFSVKVMTADPF
jgi:hypothetical protein